MAITSILTGFTSARPNAQSLFGGEHYAEGLTLDTVRKELFDWQGIEADLSATVLTADGVTTTTLASHKAIVRSDNGLILGVVGRGYQVHQYDEWLAENVQNLLDDDVQVQSAGLLGDGSKAWVQIARPENTTTAGFTYRPFIMAGTSMDGSTSTFYKQNVIAIVCENTYRASLSAKVDEQIRVKHTRNSAFRLQTARDALGVIFQAEDDFAAEVEGLLAMSVSDNQFERIVAEITQPSTESKRSTSIQERKTDDLLNLWRNDERVTPWKNTGLGAMQALSTYRQWMQTVRGTDRVTRNADNLMTGIGDKADLAEFGLIRQFATV